MILSIISYYVSIVALMQIKLASTICNSLSDKRIDQSSKALPEYFDLNHQTLFETKEVLSQMDLQLNNFPSLNEANKIVLKSVAGSILTTSGFNILKSYFSENLADWNYQNIILNSVAAVSGFAIGFRFSISGFLKSQAKKAELFLKKIRDMKDSSMAIDTKGSSSIKKFAVEPFSVGSGKFGKINTILSSISDVVGVIGVAYVSANFINFTDPTLKSFVPFLVSSLSYLMFNNYIVSRNADQKSIDKIVNTKERIQLMHTYIDVKLDQ